MEEIWRPVVGYEGLYEVSSTGRVRNSVRGKLLRPGADHQGYLKCVLCKMGKTKTIYIHRLVAQAFIPNPMYLEQVNHMDEDKTNNRVDNLEWCTARYNVNYGCAQEKRVKSNIINGRVKYTGHKQGEYNKEYSDEYRKKNKEKINERRRKYYAEHREEMKEKGRKYMREYREKNREKIREKHREYMREYRKSTKK